MNPNSMKNAFFGWLYSSPAMLLAIDAQTAITIVSAVILPLVFFAVGKFIDVKVQIYLQRQKDKQNENDR